jgi:hypothetical protein
VVIEKSSETMGNCPEMLLKRRRRLMGILLKNPEVPNEPESCSSPGQAPIASRDRRFNPAPATKSSQVRAFDPPSRNDATCPFVTMDEALIIYVPASRVRR